MSWALEAIEREALVRAEQQLMSGEGVRMFGLTAEQINGLRNFFITHTGRQPHEVLDYLRKRP